MKVKELIERLSKSNPNADVVFVDCLGEEEIVEITDEGDKICLEACE